jgi:hypothetical protein
LKRSPPHILADERFIVRDNAATGPKIGFLKHFHAYEIFDLALNVFGTLIEEIF